MVVYYLREACCLGRGAVSLPTSLNNIHCCSMPTAYVTFCQRCIDPIHWELHSFIRYKLINSSQDTRALYSSSGFLFQCITMYIHNSVVLMHKCSDDSYVHKQVVTRNIKVYQLQLSYPSSMSNQELKQKGEEITTCSHTNDNVRNVDTYDN